MFFHKMILSATALSALAVAADTTSAFTIKPTGLIDLRPSYTSKTGEFHTEDSLELGAQITPDVSVTYLQGFMSNLYNPALSVEGGLNTKIDVGFIRTRVKNILKNDAGDLTFGYQSRIYVPVNKGAQDAGQVFAARNYLTLTKKVSNSLSLTFIEMPILFLHDHAGYVDSSGVAKANQAYENRVYLIGAVSFSEKLSLEFPLMFHQTKMRNFRADAADNGNWKHFVWINPEITYQIDPTYAVALGYYSDNLVKSDLSGVTIGDGLEQGVVQVSFAASL